MKLKNIAANQTELHFPNGDIWFFSYETIVALYKFNGYKPSETYITKKKWSKTTTKHVTQFLERLDLDFLPINPNKPFQIWQETIEVTQEELEEMTSETLYRKKGNPL